MISEITELLLREIISSLLFLIIIIYFFICICGVLYFVKLHFVLHYFLFKI